MLAPLRVVIVDDHPLARDALRVALGFCRNWRVEVVGEAVDGDTALELARCLVPDVITMDIDLPGMNGLEATRQIKKVLPQVTVIKVTVNADRESRGAAAQAGAAGYVTKDNLLKELPVCLERLYSSP